MDEASQKRKERLAELKKRKLAATGQNGDAVERDVSLSFRNYDPINSNLKSSDSAIATPADIKDTVEKQMEGVVEAVLEADKAKRAQDVDIFSLAAKKPNWDLKRDVEEKLAKLDRKTKSSIIELVMVKLGQ